LALGSTPCGFDSSEVHSEFRVQNDLSSFLSSRSICKPEPYAQHSTIQSSSQVWEWATYTDTQKVAMLLGSIPPKLDRQHRKAWVVLMFSTCTQLIYLLQSHSRLTQPPVLPSTSLSATISPSPPPDDIKCQVCQSPFDEHQMLLCDKCNAGWHMGCLLPPLTQMTPMQPASPPTPDSNTTPSPSFPHSRFRL